MNGNTSLATVAQYVGATVFTVAYVASSVVVVYTQFMTQYGAQARSTGYPVVDKGAVVVLGLCVLVGLVMRAQNTSSA